MTITIAWWAWPVAFVVMVIILALIFRTLVGLRVQDLSEMGWIHYIQQRDETRAAQKGLLRMQRRHKALIAKLRKPTLAMELAGMSQEGGHWCFVWDSMIKEALKSEAEG